MAEAHPFTRYRRILLFGSSGQLSTALIPKLGSRAHVIVAGRTAAPALDLRFPDEVRRFIKMHNPDLIVNAAAYTAVDRAESEESLAVAINGHAPEVMAEEAQMLGIPLVHFSTDYVFDGTKAMPWLESDEPRPLGAYGRSKLLGEQAVAAACPQHFIFRTSWVYSPDGHNIVKTVLKLLGEREELQFVNDQHGTPTSAGMLADAMCAVIPQLDQAQPGLYHLTCKGETTWFHLVEAIKTYVDERGFACKVKAVKPITSNTLNFAAKRPENSRLCCDKFDQTFPFQRPDWRAALTPVLDQLLQPVPDPQGKAALNILGNLQR